MAQESVHIAPICCQQDHYEEGILVRRCTQQLTCTVWTGPECTCQVQLRFCLSEELRSGLSIGTGLQAQCAPDDDGDDWLSCAVLRLPSTPPSVAVSHLARPL